MRKVFYVVWTVVGILIIVIIASFLYAVYQVGAPPKFAVKSIAIDDVEGYPSLVIDFATDKYAGLVFKLFDEKGKLIDTRFPTEGETRATLSLVGLRPYTSILEPKTYILKVFYNDKEIFSKRISVKGVAIEARLVDYRIEEFMGRPALKTIVVEITNVGDAPLYVCEVVCSPPLKIFVDGEEAVPSIVAEKKPIVIKPGESKQLRIDVLPIQLERQSVEIEMVIGSIKQSFSITLAK